MKSKFLLFALVLMSAATVQAQVLVATLTHNDTTTAYYGGYAFQQALAAADHGDVINLSEGTFQSTTITKAVTIQGAGMLGSSRTVLAGQTTFNIDNTITNHFVKIEGLYFPTTNDMIIEGNFDNAAIYKCYLKRMQFQSNSHAHNISILNCIFTSDNGIFSLPTYINLNATIINTYMESLTGCNNGSSHSAHCINCMIYGYHNYNGDNSRGNNVNSSFENCIFHGWGLHNRTFSDFSTATNCIFIGWPYVGGNNFNCVANLTYEQVFKTYRGGLPENDTFAILTDSAASTFLGSDGTQVGLYGGYIPFDPTPSYPQIIKMNVAKKTTADGKLSVDIEVSTATDSNEE